MLDKIKSHKRPVHLLFNFMVFTFATVYYQYVTLGFNFAQGILQNYDSKTFSVLFRMHMGFLTRSRIHMQPESRPIRFRPIYYSTSTLPEISTSGFSLRCRVSVKRNNKTKKLSNPFHS